MRKQGFTLLETIVCIFILIILFNVGIALSKWSNSLSSDIKYSGNVYEIQNLLTYGKAVCREKNRYGKITVKSSKNEIRFVEGWDNIEKVINLPSEIKIISEDISALVTPEGKINKGATIKLLYKNGERVDITIRVGVDLIVIKNDTAI
ncbi:prepilin-type N-terminal cleavage/methylation domain-containing protein [Clostridium sp.]|uniref:prepilin-type N-terminal cleavage/methylation domain-containing protein n=1 Tax=Clostridium sp. TaxID=1506 RepID=UPI002603A2F7|nr:prepilin-type N-terminal cleavage/methylation domain-containing protein [Clostridium sp.]